MKYFLWLLLFLSIFSCNSNKTKPIPYIDLSKFNDGIHHWELYSKIRSEARFDTTDVISIANNLVAYQNADGGWPKNIDWLAKLKPDSVKNALSERYQQSTFDNRNIFPQIEYLSQAYYYTNIEKYKIAAKKGFEYILREQFPKGGWKGWDADAITYNDDVMTGIMELLLSVKEGRIYLDWLSQDLKTKLLEAYDKGLQVILKCQIEVDKQKTAWCQQHHPVTYEPIQGRKYEHPSITARESSDIVLFLMKIENPSEEVKQAITSAVSWFERAKIIGYDYQTITIPERPYHETTVNFDRRFIADKNAQPVWARYYDLDESKPFLSKVNGKIVYDLDEISFDRRIGYDWYGYWPKKVLAKYGKWKDQN